MNEKLPDKIGESAVRVCGTSGDISDLTGNAITPAVEV